jgi:hypothetical protein
MPVLAMSISEVVSGEDNIRSFSDSKFFSERIYQENDLVYRAAVGNLKANSGENEIATCSRNGKVVVSYGTRWSWESETVHISKIGNLNEVAQVYSIDSGDLLPEEEGDELVAVDEDDAVNLISYNEGSGKWKSDVIWEDEDWLLEVDIGDLVGGSDQPEIVTVGVHKRATMLSKDGAFWRNTTIATDIDVFDACWIGDVYQNRSGNEVIMGGGRGVVISAYLEEGIWKQEDLISVGSQITDLLIVDLDPAKPGNEIYATTLAGDLHQIWLENGNWKQEKIHSNGGKVIYGLETGLVDGKIILSIATWTNHVGIFWYEDGIQFRIIYQEEFYLMGTGIFDIDPAYDGNEIVGLSYLGRVTMIYQDDPGAEVLLPFNRIEVAEGETVKVPLIVEGRGGYQGYVSLSPAEPENHTHFSIQISSSNVKTGTIAILSITGLVSNGNDVTPPIRIQASTLYGNRSTYLIIDVKDDIIGSGVNEPVIDIVVPADGQNQVSIDMIIGDLTPLNLEFNSKLLPRGVHIQDLDGEFELIGKTQRVNGFISSDTWLANQNFRFFIIANIDGVGERPMGVNLTIIERTNPNFKMSLKSPFISIPRESNTTVDLLLISEFGFNGSVSIEQIDIIEGIEISFSQRTIVPSGEIKMTIEINDPTAEEVLIGIIGVSENIEREVFLSISIEPLEKDIIIDYERDGYILEDIDSERSRAQFTVLLTPVNGDINDLNIRISGLPDNYSLSISPNSIHRLYFPLNVTFIIEGPRNEEIPSINVNLSNGQGEYWDFEVILLDDQNDSKNNDPSGLLILLIILGLIGIGALIMFLYSWKTRGLNRDDSYEGPDDKDHSLPRRSATPERFDGSRGGHGRIRN